MYNLTTRTRGLWLTVLCIVLCCSIFPLSVQAEQLQRTITISEDQEWGQIIVESDVSNFEVDIITPDGSTWKHSDETDVDVLFYYGFENMRHWATETLKAGTYQILIDGPADATYTIRNQDSYEQIKLNLTQPSKQTIPVTSSSFKFDVAWSYTGDVLRNNEIDFFIVPADGREKIEIGTSSVSLNRWSLTIPDELIDGSYTMLVIYDNSTADHIEINPDVTFQVKRGYTGEKITIMDVAPAGSDLYAELNLPHSLPHSNVAAIDVALVEGGASSNFAWTRYELSELTKVEAPLTQDANTTDYQYRYAAFIPVPQNGSYKLAVRTVSSNGLPGAISISEQEVNIQAKEWPENIVNWSLPDGVTNVKNGELTITYDQPIHVQLLADGEQVFSEQIYAAAEPWVMQIPLSEGEHSYELVLYDDYGNYFTDGRIWTVDHTAPWLEMIGPLPTHKHIPDSLVSGWTEKNVTLRINDKEVAVDENGYFQQKIKGSSVDIVVTDESGNETVYHWSAGAGASGLTMSQWILLIIGIVIVVGLGVYLFVKYRK